MRSNDFKTVCAAKCGFETTFSELPHMVWANVCGMCHLGCWGVFLSTKTHKPYAGNYLDTPCVMRLAYHSTASIHIT